jgi:diguanylate cyclase (GGDEF)-like protein/PAS domain S-box-containing protein
MSALDASDQSRRDYDASLEVWPAQVAYLLQELDDVRAQLADSEETLRAIRHGEVDALVITAGAGQQHVFTLSNADRPYRNFVENMSDGAATVSSEGIVLYANQAFADLVALASHQVVGRPVLQFVTEASRARLADMVGAEGLGASVEATLSTSSGNTVPVRISSSSALQVDGDEIICLTIMDLTRERLAEAALAHSAQHDALTNLPNRTLLTDRIRHALERRRGEMSVLALLFCDVDGFKNINDAYGHQVGDDMLRLVADRLCTAVRPEDTVARIGGDEFVVLCESLDDYNDAATIAYRASAAVAAAITTGPADLEVTVSIGVAVAAVGDEATADTLLRDADEAMYKAKRQGPNFVELFDEQLRDAASSSLRLLAEMRRAEADRELRLHYQPVVQLQSEAVSGVEALIRWQHPTRGLVPPDEFIPFAERSGLVVGIGAWVMHQACEQAAAWAKDMPLTAPQLSMSVNVSGRQLAKRAGLVQAVYSALDESCLEPKSLVLEITESALMDDAETALRVLTELKSLGVRIAIDDFGTGYSSLVYLKRFPVDLLKIDRSFVAGLGRDQEDAAIVRSVIDLAHALGIATVAEGVETPQHLEILQDLGCHYGQGYLWSPAVPARQAVEWARHGSTQLARTQHLSRVR